MEGGVEFDTKGGIGDMGRELRRRDEGLLEAASVMVGNGGDVGTIVVLRERLAERRVVSR